MSPSLKTVPIAAIVIVWIACSVKQTAPQEANSPKSEEIIPQEEHVQKEASNAPVNEPDSASMMGNVGRSKSSDPVKILRTGTFHEDEVWENVEEEKWFGLIFRDEGFALSEMEIDAVRVADELFDDVEEGEKTGWEIQTATGEQVIVLVTNIAGLTNRKATHADVPAQIYPGDTIEFSFFGVPYTLFATGQDKVMNTVHSVTDYKLYLSRDAEPDPTIELLVSHPAFDDAMTSILWVGDIDGDEKPDVLIDRTDHYNVSAPALFLSRPATPGHLLQFIAEHRTVGC